ncbi:G-protein-coupled receptor family protein [Dictyostelium discoideum AX4]|uniref:Frizzled and smoothened-like protein L n=1 Tax=Dictyostelium discoideum TaxID=44689 RepID=FSLL_DICDI|nr:G-protein-coupled receptor family protein [Dictyostelium discoideum AX4]Q54PF8.1 RecName: Full=Frizzled and smoothened-like protein L; Flags: Precursor [Dictyostelium discoideum]EAL65147.1 G-protein-coupled receptor family protein [Dictyostelium discoideum AX4]|eukprot:XP_638502.1 G-protein-coupled receptor family protein [Dictyostelium discoideum AX4]
MITNKSKYYFFLILIFINFYLINCQEEYPIDQTGKCEPYIGDSQITKCSTFLPNINSIYVSANSTQKDSMKTLDNYFGLLLAVGSEKCKDSSLTYQTLCSMYLKECESFTDNSTLKTVSIPKRICRKTCNDVTKLCNIESLFNCSQNEPINNLPLCPLNYSIYDLSLVNGDSNYELQCYSPLSNDSIEIPVTNYCPFPLIYINSTDHSADEDRGYMFVSGNSNCVVPNPVPLYTPKQWDRLYDLSNSLSVLSCVGTLFLLFTFNILNKKINRFDRMNSLFNGSVFMMSLSGVIILFAGGPRALIKDGGARISVWQDPLCSATGFIFQLFSIAAILFWVVMSFELWYKIKFMTKKLDLKKYYIPFIIIVSLVFSIIPLATKNYRMIRGNMHCWVHTTKLQNSLFWIPLGIAITIGTIFIGLVMFEIHRIVSANSKGGVLKLEIKSILNVALIYLTFIYLFAFNFYMNGQEGVVYGQIESFYQCTLENDASECTIQGPSIGSLGFFIFCIRIYGVYCFILQGLNYRAYNIWKESIFFNNRFVSYIKNNILNIETSSTGSGGTSTTASATTTTTTKKHNGIDSLNIDSAFSKNNESDDEDDYDPYKKSKNNITLKDIEVSKS